MANQIVGMVGATGPSVNIYNSPNAYNGQSVGNLGNASETLQRAFNSSIVANAIKISYCSDAARDIELILDGVSLGVVSLAQNWPINTNPPTLIIKNNVSFSAGSHTILFKPTAANGVSLFDYFELVEVVQAVTPKPVITSTTMVAGTPPFSCTTAPNAAVSIYVNGGTTASQTATADANGVVNLSALGFSVVAADVLTIRATASGSTASPVSDPVTVSAAPSFGNVVKSQSFTRNNCAAGQVGSAVTYIVPANTHSASTQAAANTLADNDIAANGQTYANTNGACTIPPATPSYATSITGSQIINGSSGNSGSGKAGSSNIPSGSVFSVLSGSATNCSVTIDPATGNYVLTDTGGTTAHNCNFTIQIKDANSNILATIPVTIPVAAKVANTTTTTTTYYEPAPKAVTGNSNSGGRSDWWTWLLLVGIVFGFYAFFFWLFPDAETPKEVTKSKPQKRTIPAMKTGTTFGKS